MWIITLILGLIAFGSLTFLWGYFLGWDGAMQDMRDDLTDVWPCWHGEPGPGKDNRATR